MDSWDSQSQNLQEANKALKLTPQEQNLYTYHLGNLYGSGKVTQPGGDISTLLQVGITGPDGRYYNIPTVWGGKVLPPFEAAAMALEHGGWEHWPSYASEKEAEARYRAMHQYFDRDVAAFRSQQ